MMLKPRIQFPRKLQPLFQPAPYKSVRGGRGSAKSWGFCRAGLALGANRPLTILCTREVQNSIDESVYKLLSDQIPLMGLDHMYDPYDQEIRGKNGTRFIFAGLKNQFNKIKSYEAIDLCMVFEAAHISDPAWEALLPTIRRDAPFGPFGQGSETWVEWNPDLISDATYKRWVTDPLPGTIVIELNYIDNPWFPEILRVQMETMKAKDHAKYLNVWMGKPKRVLEGAVYAKELAAAIGESPSRISPHVRYNPKKPVIVVFDLGRADTCSLWFIQQIGADHAVIDYYGGTGYDFSHYIDVINGHDAETGEKTHRAKYRISKVILPHDAKHKVISAKHSILRQARDEWGVERVPKPLPATKSVVRINALRAIFPRLWFAEGPTSEGVQGLTHYAFGINDKGQRTADPLHNWASHPANSLEHYALSLQPDIYQDDEEDDAAEEEWNTDTTTLHDQQTGWMR